MADGNGIGTNKATAGSVGAGGGAGIGGAVATLILAAMHNTDPTVAVALSTVLSAVIGAGGAYLAAYLTPHGGA